MRSQKNATASTQSPYTNLPLCSATSIRLFKLIPFDSDNDELLEVEIYTVDLDEVRKDFDALSYTWDLDELAPDCRVLANGQQMMIGANLHSFLSQLSTDSVKGPFWADALCINQISNDEKNHQVRLMSKIYSSAACTRSWLGNTLNHVAQLMLEFAQTASLSWLRLRSQDHSSPPELLVELVNHRYWTRTWILQELILADEIIVHCCSAKLPWQAFVRFARRICAKAGIQYLTTYGSTILMQIDAQRRETSSRSLSQLVERYGRAKCSDLRDRVFAMLGLITASDDPLQAGRKNETSGSLYGGIVDYSSSLFTVYTKLLRLYRVDAQSTFSIILWRALELHRVSPGERAQDHLITIPVTILSEEPPTNYTYTETFSAPALGPERLEWVRLDFVWTETSVRSVYWKLDAENDSVSQKICAAVVAWDCNDDAESIEPYATGCCSAFRGALLEHTDSGQSTRTLARAHISATALKLLHQYWSMQVGSSLKSTQILKWRNQNERPYTDHGALQLSLSIYHNLLMNIQVQLLSIRFDMTPFVDQKTAITLVSDLQHSQVRACLERMHQDLADIAILDTMYSHRFTLYNEKETWKGTRQISAHYRNKGYLVNSVYESGRPRQEYLPDLLKVLGSPVLLVHKWLSKQMARMSEQFKLEYPDGYGKQSLCPTTPIS